MGHVAGNLVRIGRDEVLDPHVMDLPEPRVRERQAERQSREQQAKARTGFAVASGLHVVSSSLLWAERENTQPFYGHRTKAGLDFAGCFVAGPPVRLVHSTGFALPQESP